jgi:hypothetical protein
MRNQGIRHYSFFALSLVIVREKASYLLLQVTQIVKNATAKIDSKVKAIDDTIAILLRLKRYAAQGTCQYKEFFIGRIDLPAGNAGNHSAEYRVLVAELDEQRSDLFGR